MSEIRYVCLSDLHLGEEDSVLSNMNEDGTEGDPSRPGPGLQQLALCIKDLAAKLWKKNKPILILNGDVLELALCPIHKASMAFQCFVNELRDKNGFLFEKIILVPGNHDHHLWVMTREDQYLDYLQRKRQKVVTLPSQWHSTKLFARQGDPPVLCHFLGELIKRPPVNLDFKIEVAYPNLGIIEETKLTSKQMPKQCVVFHHGHFTEWIYGAISTVNDWIFDPNNPPARHAWKLEKENFAWIDFVWSALGQSWDGEQGLETVYDKALDDTEFREVLANLSAGLIKEFFNRSSFEWIEKAGIDQGLKLLYRLFGGSEKGHTDATLSRSGIKQLFQYAEGPLHAQICYDIVALQKKKDELNENAYTADYFKGTPAPPTTFIFGHTHKPFARREAFHGYSAPVDVYNSGGWVVETLQRAPVHGGSIILVDDQLNVAGIRMYNENKDHVPVDVKLETLPPPMSPNPLANDLGKLDFSSDPWKTFSEMAASIIPVRRRYLNKRVFSALPRPR